MRACTKISLVFALAFLAGCVGRTTVIPTPSWHTLGSGLYDVDGDRVIYGIGEADGVHNPALLRASADNQARKELTSVLENYISTLIQSGVLETDPHWAALSVGDRQQATGMLVRNCLKQAVVSDHWNDTQQARLRSLCRLDLATVKQILSDFLSLDEKSQSAVWAEADKVHARLARPY